MAKYDIIDRSLSFAVLIIKLSNKLPRTPAGFAIAQQLIASGTSIGANIEEAQDSISKKEFIKTMNISLKECRETLYWLELIKRTNLIETLSVDPYIQEGKEIRAILAAIIKKSKLSLL
ncbi:four helix bundle protein [Candidatus Gottesmanbacteria bacterium]|nr:four helix bundle protein [Candidatus Gottesmanbacteria bacterium]